MSSPATALFNRAVPLVFVFIWSTGWIVARYETLVAKCTPAAEPVLPGGVTPPASN